mmetsp:Transcript_37531/g.110939  ORF Transcript_37531/g.110939 Transcript_37531/m.110939 type:complete len:88 (+) Transcript_37531:103-366(+)
MSGNAWLFSELNISHCNDSSPSTPLLPLFSANVRGWQGLRFFTVHATAITISATARGRQPEPLFLCALTTGSQLAQERRFAKSSAAI